MEGGVFEERDSEIAKIAKETNISTKTPDYEYHSEPLRQQRRLIEDGDFEEKDSDTAVERTKQLIHLDCEKLMIVFSDPKNHPKRKI